MAPSPLPPPDHLFPCATTTSVTVSAAGVRRKTPSELRQEQLNRVVRSRNSQDGTISALPSPGSTTDQQKKTYLRLVDKYATTKSHERSKFTSSKQKDDFNKAFPNGNIEASRPLRRSTEELCSVVTSQDVLPRNAGSSAAAKNQSGNFRDVTQLSSKTKVQASGLALDMTEALKIMAPAAGRSFSGMTMGPGFASQFPDSSSYIKISLLDKFKRPPIDLSLKLSARFLSVDSLHWCHRISSANEVEGVKLFVERFEWDDKVDLGSQPDVLGEIGRLGRFEARFCQALHSWVHPPPQYLELYEIALAGARGDTKNFGIVTTLFRTWEYSFRSLYYMFCHNYCNTFYLCTQQSVVMFERANNVDGSANGSHVYWSRSTRGLRKKLQEQGVEFLMPFCTSDADMSPPEDLHELTEFEKLNPGHTRLMDSRTAIEKNSQSLLFFDTGNVHRLFDFLLNYRFLVGSGNATDFPVLYSPVEFSKSSLYTPEVECRRVQCPIENICKEVSMHNGSIMHSNKKVSAMLYSLELKGPPGAYITPWVIQAVCRVLQQSQKLGFEVSFVTGPLSENLNVAQDSLSAAQEVEGEESKASLLSRTYPTDVSMSKMKVIKHLRYSGGSYQANMGGSS